MRLEYLEKLDWLEKIDLLDEWKKDRKKTIKKIQNKAKDNKIHTDVNIDNYFRELDTLENSKYTIEELKKYREEEGRSMSQAVRDNIAYIADTISSAYILRLRHENIELKDEEEINRYLDIAQRLSNIMRSDVYKEIEFKDNYMGNDLYNKEQAEKIKDILFPVKEKYDE